MELWTIGENFSSGGAATFYKKPSGVNWHFVFLAPNYPRKWSVIDKRIGQGLPQFFFFNTDFKVFSAVVVGIRHGGKSVIVVLGHKLILHNTKASATIDITAVVVMDPISSNCTSSQRAKVERSAIIIGTKCSNFRV